MSFASEYDVYASNDMDDLMSSPYDFPGKAQAPQGYHAREIEKGELGKASKIREEFEEFLDANDQGNVVMELIELSDLLGAIELYIEKYNITLDELLIMKDATKRAFQSGRRR